MAIQITSKGQIEDTFVAGDMMDVLAELNGAAKRNERFALLNDLNGDPCFLEITNITRGRVFDDSDTFMKG